MGVREHWDAAQRDSPRPLVQPGLSPCPFLAPRTRRFPLLRVRFGLD